ncbi:hypothetical protein C8R43DRAFT_1132833 [Mycena crocata]|nr:hypothetical protein C8R43DRAFT_1132833 [Mycena crocata]
MHARRTLLPPLHCDKANTIDSSSTKPLAGDSWRPHQGAQRRRDIPKVEAALTITADTAHSTNLNELIFLNTLDLTPETPIIKRMRACCAPFLPGLEKARLESGPRVNTRCRRGCGRSEAPCTPGAGTAPTGAPNRAAAFVWDRGIGVEF